jgi:hypothetical protein
MFMLLCIGSSGGATSPGYVHAVFGASTRSTVALATLTAAQGFALVGETVGAQFGSAIAAGRDSNGDGLPGNNQQ